MSPDPLITIILPTFRRPSMLPKAIQSALDQNFPHFTLSIYDNCSNDETPSVVNRYAEQDPRIKYHCHAQNIGAAANYSYALGEVRTPFFSFLADDDWLLPTFCSSALAAFDAFPAAQFVVGRTLFDTAGSVIPSNAARYRPGFYSQPHGMLTLLKNRFPPWIGILFRTEALKEIGPYVTEDDGIDFGFLLRASHLEFAVVDRDVAVFRSHAGSSSERLPLKMVWPSHLKAADSFLQSQRTAGVSRSHIVPVLYGYVSWIVRVACTSALRYHEYEEAKAAALILRIRFHKRVQGSLLGILAELMMRSNLIGRLIDNVSTCKVRMKNLVRSFCWSRFRGRASVTE